MSKPRMFSFGREWPLDEIPIVQARVDIAVRHGDVERVREQLTELLEGFRTHTECICKGKDSACWDCGGSGQTKDDNPVEMTIKVEVVALHEMPEPERTEYHRLQDEVYNAYLAGRSPN